MAGQEKGTYMGDSWVVIGYILWDIFLRGFFLLCQPVPCQHVSICEQTITPVLQIYGCLTFSLSESFRIRFTSCILLHLFFVMGFKSPQS